MTFLGTSFSTTCSIPFAARAVFNSENHLSTDGSGPAHVPMNHTRSVLWQGGLHHQGSTTIWVWEMSTDPSLSGNIYFRPANIFGAGRAMLDLNRLAPEVTAINHARPRVALLYSPAVHFLGGEIQRNAFLHLHRAQFHGRANNLCQRAATGRGHGGQSQLADRAQRDPYS